MVMIIYFYDAYTHAISRAAARTLLAAKLIAWSSDKLYAYCQTAHLEIEVTSTPASPPSKETITFERYTDTLTAYMALITHTKPHKMAFRHDGVARAGNTTVGHTHLRQ